jgi:hypothetical protein
MMSRHKRTTIVLVLSGITFGVSAAADGQTWSNAQLLNLSGESPQGAIKKPDVCRAAAGGFHILYRHHLSGGVPMKYRRYSNSSLGPVVWAANPPNYAWDQYICEAGNGDLHISWENWDSTPNTGWTKSTSGGLTWAPYIEITSFTNSAKAPRIAPYGAASSAAIMCVVWNPADKTMYSNYYNGTTWNGATSTGIGCDSEYQIFGISRSPLDGSIYAGGDRGSSTVRLMQYNGSWSAQDVDSPGFFARQSVAVNGSGQVMVCWEKDGAWYSRLYTPGSGWGATQTVDGHGGFGSVIALPGTSNFYSAYAQGNSPSRIRGKMWNGAWWGTEEVISVGLPDAQALDPRIAVATDGSMFCCWEWWGNGNAEGWYSVRGGSPPGPSGTLSGVVRDQYGVGVPNVQISTVSAGAISGAGGAYSMSIPAGTYTVTASTAYYTGQTVNNVVITQNQTTTQNFTITGQPPAAVSSFTATPSSTANLLQWTNPTSPQFTATRIVYRADRFAGGPSDGTVLIDDAAGPGSVRSFNHTGRTNGATCYYTAYAYFQDASRFYAGGVSDARTPSVKPDMDHDGDVDQVDFGLFQACYSGPFVAQDLPACQQAKFDEDTDVDLDDTTVFLDCFMGPGTYANPACAG